MLHNLHKFVMIKKMLPSSFKILYAFRRCSPFSLLVLFFHPSFMVAVINGNDQTRLLRNAWW